MSADNWTICPRCAVKGYQAGIFDTDDTLREDYEQGIYEFQPGKFEYSVHYVASCSECGFYYVHEYRKPIEGMPDEVRAKDES